MYRRITVECGCDACDKFRNDKDKLEHEWEVLEHQYSYPHYQVIELEKERKEKCVQNQ